MPLVAVVRCRVDLQELTNWRGGQAAGRIKRCQPASPMQSWLLAHLNPCPIPVRGSCALTETGPPQSRPPRIDTHHLDARRAGRVYAAKQPGRRGRYKTVLPPPTLSQFSSSAQHPHPHPHRSLPPSSTQLDLTRSLSKQPTHYSTNNGQDRYRHLLHVRPRCHSR